MSPRDKDAIDDKDCFVSDKEMPVDAAMSLAMMEDEEGALAIASIIFGLGGFAKSSSDTNLRLSESDDICFGVVFFGKKELVEVNGFADDTSGGL